MGSIRPRVTVADIEENNDSATATLRTDWSVAGSTWSFTTEAVLVYADDAWKVDWKPSVVAPTLVAGERLQVRVTQADRGDILGARGEPLITERRVERLGIDKTRVNAAQVRRSAAAFARTLDISVEGYVERVEAAGPQAFAGRYAPGSTFKVVTALALLRSGLKPTSAVVCTPTLTVDGREFRNYSDYPASFTGRIDLRSAIANSCNTALIANRSRAQPQPLATAAAALGLGPDVDLGTPAYLGSVPRKALGTEHAASMIGQGRILVSPLAMAVVAASIAKGSRINPTVLADKPTKPAAESAEALTGAEAKQLQEMFRAAVTRGSGTFLSDVPGGPVSAKTGTAEYGEGNPPRTHAWMIASQGDLAVAVFVADGESGSRTAGPLLEEFLRAVP